MLNEDEFDELYGSKYLGAADLKDGNKRVKIGKVDKADLREKDGTKKKKFVLTSSVRTRDSS